VADDIEQRLTAAAEALREYEVAARRGADLRGRQEAMAAQLAALRAASADEQRDVDRLEGVTLTRVLASLRGARDDALARERAEADAARYQVAQAQARLDAVHREYDATQERLSRLTGAPRAFAALLEEKEERLRTSADPRGARLLEFAGERGRLAAELREVGEALRAAAQARHALSEVLDRLGSASGWSTYDTFFGGGALSSAVKHSRLDEAAQAAAQADRCLAVLRTELADVNGMTFTAPQLVVTGLTRFVDIWFDNIFTDLAVRDRIKQAQRNVAQSMRLVHDVAGRLNQRAAQAHARLATIDTERTNLLTR
jgi:hypothetical protein